MLEKNFLPLYVKYYSTPTQKPLKNKNASGILQLLASLHLQVDTEKTEVLASESDGKANENFSNNRFFRFAINRSVWK